MLDDTTGQVKDPSHVRGDARRYAAGLVPSNCKTSIHRFESGRRLHSSEFVGPNEERGWPLAGTIVPIAYLAWSAWLIALGVFLIL
jgi:hypothetical protein